MPDGREDDRAWSVYILRCGDGSLYTGIALDVPRRIEAHANARTGARYLRGRGPLELVGHWTVGDRGLATRVEHRIKRLSRVAKERLIASPARIADVLSGLRQGDGAAGSPA